MAQQVARPVRGMFILLLTILLLSLLSCTGMHLSEGRSSTTKRIDNKAPYYDGKVDTVSDRIGHLPIKFDNRLQEARVGPGILQSLLPVTEKMNTLLDGLNISSRLTEIDLPISEAPDIYVGDSRALGITTISMDRESDENSPFMVIYKSNPSKTWRERLSQVLATGDVDYVLFITVGLSDFFPRQKGFFGGKVLELGTDHAIEIGWLSDLDTPAEVFYVCGALLDREGEVVRAGAEGIIAKETGFFTSAFGIQDILSDEDIQKLLDNERRDDLPGKPLKWKTALRNLAAQLLNRDDLMIR